MENDSRRESCRRCNRPLCVCYCSSLPSVPLVTDLTHVLVLQHQHEKERRGAISSVPVLAQTIANVTLVTVDASCDCGPGQHEQLDALLYNDNGEFDAAMILYPAKHAEPLKKRIDCKTERVLLIVLDGTWKEAKKIARRNVPHWENAANEWARRGRRLQFVCLDNESQRSIYGGLRR